MKQVYNDILTLLEKIIDTAQTKEEKLAFATKKLSLSAFEKVAKGEIPLEEAEAEEPKDSYDTINALSLAICLGATYNVKKMLKLFDKDSLNDENNFVWGYRQPYSFLHVAAHPQVVLSVPDAFESPDVQANAHIAIIRLLAKCGADPSLVIKQDRIGYYENAPLAAGTPSGTYFPPNQIHQVRGALLLVGADPDYKGSCYTLYPEDRSNAIKEAAKQYICMSPDERSQVASVINKDIANEITTILLDSLRPLQALNVEQVNQPRFKAGMF